MAKSNKSVIRAKCETCQKKIPKHQPKLRCSICNDVKHLACQKLTKSDANLIIHSKLQWTCRECIFEILPVNACQQARRGKHSIVEKFKVKCFSCHGYSYTARNVRTCDYCDNKVHLKCWNNSLGCTRCCEEIVPGFHACTYEIIGDPYLKNDQLYNPYSSSHYTQQIGDAIERETESNEMFSNASEVLVSCKYKMPMTIAPPNDFELCTFSLNVRSLIGKIDKLRENIAFYDKFDVLLFNETNCIKENLSNGLADINLDGFHGPILQNPLRTSGKGGGLAIYVNKRVCSDEENIVPFVPYNEPDNNHGEFQFIKIKECKGHRKTVILGNAYRTPSYQPDKFNKYFDALLQKLNSNRYKNKIKYIVGDFNQDLIKYDNNVDYQNLIDNAHNHGFVQLVSRPTRITEHSATLIDHVYTNNVDSTLSCNILTVDLSDHLAIHTKISLTNSSEQPRRNTVNPNNSNNMDEIRLFNEANNEKFKNLITDETWSEISDEMDAQTAFTKFEDIYLKHYNAAYPPKSQRIRRKNERVNPKPWILPWLETACARKQAAYHKFIKTPSPENKAEYDKLNSFCEKHIILAKAKYRKSYFEKYQHDSRKQWQMINNLLNRKSNTTSITKLVDENGKIENNPNSIAESFNNYFSNIASKLKNENKASQETEESNNDVTYQKFLNNPVGNTIYLNSVSASEIFKIIKNLKNKSTKDTKISALKLAGQSYSFTSILAMVIDKSFQEGTFPEQLKIAKVIPIHKEGSRQNVGNYRPISLLSSFSKIYEKLMHQRILDFLTLNNSLFEMQYGFRPGRSCEHALLNAQSTLLDSLNRCQVSLLLLIDFSKAFDMVDHSILLKKLYHYGIRGSALKWMESYLRDRKQFVSVSGANSPTLHMKFGVPQGSILGPLLFIIYINDIPEIASFAKFILYADDANIILTAPTIEEVFEQLETLVKNLVDWVNFNGLALNLQKTKYMIFSRSRNIELPTPLIISKLPIERKREARFLGVIIDESLNWTSHINTVLSKMARYVGIMYKLKNTLPLKARLQIYHSFVQSHLNFCSIVWGFSAKSNIDALFAKQKKGLRAVIPGFIRYNYRDGETPGHTKHKFSEYKILTIHNIIALNTYVFMQKVRSFTTLLPCSIKNTIATDSPVPGSTYETCTNWLRTYNNHIYHNSLFFKGPLLITTNKTVEESISPSSFLSAKLYRKNIKDALLLNQNNGHPTEWETANFPISNIHGLRKSCVTNRITIDYNEN